jgi:cytoskeletal protein RodZ
MEIGARLREARERKGLTQQDIGRATSISLQVLGAIERGDLAQLPGGLFMRAHLRAYAGQVGLDPEEIVAEHRARHEGTDGEDDLGELRRRCAGREPANRAWTYGLLLMAGVALLLAGLVLTRAAETRAADPVTGPRVVPAVEEVLPSPVPPVARVQGGGTGT